MSVGFICCIIVHSTKIINLLLLLVRHVVEKIEVFEQICISDSSHKMSLNSTMRFNERKLDMCTAWVVWWFLTLLRIQH